MGILFFRERGCFKAENRGSGEKSVWGVFCFGKKSDAYRKPDWLEKCYFIILHTSCRQAENSEKTIKGTFWINEV